MGINTRNLGHHGHPHAPPAGPDRDRPFEVFISYSHRSEAVKDRLQTHLRVLERLAERAASAPTLLVLDGLEPLQQASTDDRLAGRLKDLGIAALLEGLGRAPGQAVCLASSRLGAPDPLIDAQPAFHQVELRVLPRPGAVALLEARGIAGTPDQLDAMAARCADHPLALILAAELTHSFLGNQAPTFLARAWPRLPDTAPERHAATLMTWLGAISADLAALAGFFPAGWGQPPVTGDLSESERSWLIAAVAFCLMSLGRLDEALGPLRVGRDREREAGDWNNFCRSSENLVDLLTPLGHWGEAETVAREALAAAGRVADGDEAQHRLLALAKLGRALHGQGRPVEAARAFAEAEKLDATPALPMLVSLRGFDYARLLLEQARTPAEHGAVLGRARASLACASERGHLLSIALDHCTIGQALPGVAGAENGATDAGADRAAAGPAGGTDAAGAALDRAIATMRRASKMEFLPTLYLIRAHHRRTRSQADQLIRETGYGRREAELHLLEARLKHHQARPEEARAALARAESRLRALGQWGLWPQLLRIAAELGLPAPADPPPAPGGMGALRRAFAFLRGLGRRT